MLLALVFPLAACAGLKPSAEAPIALPDIPDEMRQCSKPQSLPAGFMTQANVERNWARDRASLLQCRNNLTGVIEYYEHLQEHLSRPEE